MRTDDFSSTAPPKLYTVQRPAYHDFRKAVKDAGMSYQVTHNKRVIELYREDKFTVAYQHRGNWPEALRWFQNTFKSTR